MRLAVLFLVSSLAAACSGDDATSGAGGSGGSSGTAGSSGSSGSSGSGASGGSSGSSGSAGSSGSGGAGGSAGSGGAPSGCAPKATGWVTDTGSYPEPALPALASAGASVVDPSFGTTIRRITDAADGGECVNAYSYWPSFNADSSRMLFACDGDPVLADFDWQTGAVAAKRPLYAGTTPNGTTPNWEDAIWSALEPNHLYAHDTVRLWRYDVVSESYTLVKDFSAVVGSGHVRQMSKSADDQVFGFTTQDSNWSVTGALAWRASDDSVLQQLSQAGLDEAQVDKTGGYLVVKTGVSGAGAIEVRVVDLGDGSIDDLTDDAPDYSPGHSDNGMGTVVGADNWTNRITFRELATPHQVTTVLDLKNDWTQDYHVSMLANDESRVTLSFYQAGSAHTEGLFHNEIVQVATDGSQAVRRLAHHRSHHSDYWDSPRANISRDGCFVAFTSTWGSSGRRDVFVVDLSK